MKNEENEEIYDHGVGMAGSLAHRSKKHSSVMV
jgi:hypothetical protein